MSYLYILPACFRCLSALRIHSFPGKNNQNVVAGAQQKIAFVCVTCFLGMGISIMGYNNDVDLSRVFSQLYETFFGTRPAGPTFVELFYSIGLTVGIFLFFDHRSGKRVTNEPTPVQVQMRLYEQQVNQTFILGASRKGEELDVKQ